MVAADTQSAYVILIALLR